MLHCTWKYVELHRKLHERNILSHRKTMSIICSIFETVCNFLLHVLSNRPNPIVEYYSDYYKQNLNDWLWIRLLHKPFDNVEYHSQQSTVPKASIGDSLVRHLSDGTEVVNYAWLFIRDCNINRRRHHRIPRNSSLWAARWLHEVGTLVLRTSERRLDQVCWRTRRLIGFDNCELAHSEDH